MPAPAICHFYQLLTWGQEFEVKKAKRVNCFRKGNVQQDSGLHYRSANLWLDMWNADGIGECTKQQLYYRCICDFVCPGDSFMCDLILFTKGSTQKYTQSNKTRNWFGSVWQDGTSYLKLVFPLWWLVNGKAGIPIATVETTKRCETNLSSCCRPSFELCSTQ